MTWGEEGKEVQGIFFMSGRIFLPLDSGFIFLILGWAILFLFLLTPEITLSSILLMVLKQDIRRIVNPSYI